MNKRMHSLILHSLFAVTMASMAPSYRLAAQQADAQSANHAPQPVVPQMMRYSGIAPTRAGDSVEAVFRIYSSAQGGEPMWSETQSIRIGADGKYSVLLGSATEGGLPDAVFQGGQGRWLGVSIERAPETGRSVLASVAYAMKAADAESLAGRQAADFVTQEQLNSKLATAQPPATPGVVHPDVTLTGAGTANTIPLWTSASNFGNSVMTQSGTKIGVNEAIPAANLDVNGTTYLRGNTNMPALGTATATGAFSSPVFAMNASSFKAGGAAVNQEFAWEVQAQNNNTASPSSVLSLLYAAGGVGLTNTGFNILPSGSVTTQSNFTVQSPAATSASGSFSPKVDFEANVWNSSTSKSVPMNFAFSALPIGNNTASPTSNLALEFATGSGVAPVATGLSFASNGLITFAPTQTFPGTGTITAIDPTSPLIGGGTSGNVTVGISEPTLVTDITPTFNGLYAQLAAANEFTQSQTVDQTLNANLVNSTLGYDIAGLPIAKGIGNLGDAFLGYADANNPTGFHDVAVGPGAMYALTSGSYNTALGASALQHVQDGSENTAVGVDAMDTVVGGCAPVPLPSAHRPGQPANLSNAARGNVPVRRDDTCANPEGYGNTGVGFNAGFNDTNGIQNTYLGYQSGPALNTVDLVGATAIGANAEVDRNYSVVLGRTAFTPGQTYANVGIGTPTPMSALDISVLGLGTLGPTITLTNPSGAGGGSASIDFNTTIPLDGYAQFYNPGARIVAEDTDYSDNLSFYSNTPGGKNNALRKNLEIFSGGGAEIYGALITTGAIAVTGNSTINGNLHVTGMLSKAGGSFKIDHPQDPANKYLSHSFVESPDMMNVYNGNIVTDKDGFATVMLPDYFEALNRDFRYQLTVIGQFAQAIVSSKVANNRFVIRTNAPAVEVSWQVTGIRQDAWANANRIPNEEDKPANQRGYYLNPELYGASADKQVGRAPKDE